MGIISRLLGRESLKTSRVDDFVKVGASVRSGKIRSSVAEISQALRDMDFEDLSIEFLGQDTSTDSAAPITTIGRRIKGADIVRRTAAGVFTDEAVKAFGLPGISGGIAHHTAVTPGSEKALKLLDFFKSQGIDIDRPEEIESFLFFSHDSITRSLPENLLLVGHETRTCSSQHIWGKDRIRYCQGRCN